MTMLSIYLDELQRCRLFTWAEERALLARAHAGDLAARNDLVQSQLRWVVRVATRYKGCGVPMEDLIQAGNMGLLRAVDRFDLRQPVRLSTYATWWIRNFLHRAIRTRHLIGIPGYQQEHRRPHRYGDAAYRASKPAVLDEQVAEGLASGDADPAEEASQRELLAQLPSRLARLDPRHAEVLRRRSRGDKLHEIAATLGVSKERVRQIEAFALGQLREEYGLSPLAAALGPWTEAQRHAAAVTAGVR